MATAWLHEVSFSDRISATSKMHVTALPQQNDTPPDGARLTIDQHFGLSSGESFLLEFRSVQIR